MSERHLVSGAAQKRPGRTLLAIIENHQLPDGGFRVPPVLHSFGAPEKVSGPSASN